MLESERECPGTLMEVLEVEEVVVATKVLQLVAEP